MNCREIVSNGLINACNGTPCVYTWICQEKLTQWAVVITVIPCCQCEVHWGALMLLDIPNQISIPNIWFHRNEFRESHGVWEESTGIILLRRLLWSQWYLTWSHSLNFTHSTVHSYPYWNDNSISIVVYKHIQLHRLALMHWDPIHLCMHKATVLGLEGPAWRTESL